MKTVFTKTILLASCLALPLMAGCQAHRVNPRTDTSGELNDGRILPAALLEFSDKAPGVIAESLPTAPIISATPGPVKIILGSIRNLTTSTNSAEFEIVTQRIQNALINNSTVNQKLTFVMDRARMKDVAAREEVVNANGTSANPPAYDANTTYVLNLDVNESSRKDTHLYYMHVTLSHFGSNTIVFSDDYTVKHEN